MNKLLKFSLPPLLILGLMLTNACAPAGAPPMPGLVPSPSEEAVEEERVPSTAEPSEEALERKIIKTGYITLEVEDIVEAMDKVAEVAGELGGYVLSSYKHEEEKGTSGSIRIRVPADRFDAAFDRLRELAIDVPYESTEAKDVTEEYIDLEARLHNLEATEAQYLALLEKAETVEEILKVQQALSNVRGQIEQIEGRMKYLERTSDMALIQVTLKQTKGLVAPWSLSHTLKSAVRGLTTLGRGLATGLIWLGVFCWVWIPILVFWLRRRRKRV